MDPQEGNHRTDWSRRARFIWRASRRAASPGWLYANRN